MSFGKPSEFVARVAYEADRADAVGHVAASPSALSSLLTDSFCDENDEECFRLRTDNYLILHQKDIENRIGADNVRKWIDALNRSSGSNEYQEVLDKLSDRELFSLVRSRHIQAPADVSRYLKDLVSDAADLSERRRSLLQRNAELAATRQAADQKSDQEVVES
ncbi:hypothetical protein [Microvirus mar47]|uniref:Internal scaffolding protein n=1 Tax=Microvirus mar47 TaxID=2851182 RepID=A0A8F5RC33_9VIRU|nr:hypothetical protein [Microvirus mar47]